MCLIPFQCLRVGAELYLANKLKEKKISWRVQLAGYISEPMILRYGTSGPSNSSPFSQGRNESFFMKEKVFKLSKNFLFLLVFCILHFISLILHFSFRCLA